MSTRPHAGKSAPDLPGTFYKFFLEQPAVDFLASNRPWPFVVMHMPKPVQQTRVAAPPLTTAADAAHTDTDAPSTGHLPASETTPDESLEEVSGLVERLNLTGASEAASAASCFQCGAQDVALKRCLRCLQVSYCEAQCQRQGWKQHKKKCEKLLSLEDVADKVFAAFHSQDFPGVVEHEGRLEELLENQTDGFCQGLLCAFSQAHTVILLGGGDMLQSVDPCNVPKDRVMKIVIMMERRAEILGKMQRFRDQGEEMASMANMLLYVDQGKEAARILERVRVIGETHGFLSFVTRACSGNPKP